ncbi:TIGR02556 family CRISPR-associated protein [Natroniella acetigena]|uniref:TIGR02556 family CRISPR-associated protein n=1 Tax=Natroniella acetigena TaxID=52004 RepID=UPI00200A3322|nr:TIGR02556 family CRISPR-associated protein [Natroniella acetigena]MCK8827886.1 TIGR02556 family CRISPR-associated protein [Natroniella acetigena]
MYFDIEKGDVRMIRALKLIGDYKQEISDENLLTQIVSNPNSNGKYNTVLIIVFKEEDGEIVFYDIEVEEFIEEKLEKYAYKYGSSRGGDLTPTCKITDLSKTFNKKFQYSIRDACENLEGENKNEKIILKIYDILQDEDNKEEIYNKLRKVNYDNNAILTIALKKEDELKYVGDFEEFTQSLMEKYEEKFYYKSSYCKAEQESIGEDNLCYVCSEKLDKTYGYVGTFAFYTLDKKGFTPGGFKRGEAWRNYPVCPECAKILDLGKDYLEKELSATFCGLNYFIVPKVIFNTHGEDREELFEMLKELEEHKKFSLQEDARKTLTAAQDDIFYVMSEFDNYVNFNLMFYEEQNSAFRILLYVEDVLPSYLQRIFAIKEDIEREGLFKELKGKDGIFDLDFKFNLISDFFYVNQRNRPDFTKQFLEIINNILTRRKISYQVLIDRFVAHMQEKFRNNKSIWFDNLKALMILKFLKKLDLLTATGEEELGVSSTIEEYREQIEEFLEQHSDILDSNVKRMVFLEGVLAQELINIQKRDRDGVAPFRPRLNGLKLNEKIVRRLYPEIINELEDYDKNLHKQLEKMIADYILESDFNQISNNELSFYFVTGMNQVHKFKFNNNEEGD